MDTKLKTKLVAALRSGKYRQGDGYLEAHGAMCCLGVCVAIQGEDVAKWSLSAKRTSRLSKEYSGGLTPDQMAQLAHRNDGTGGYRKHTFEEIADWIEANL